MVRLVERDYTALTAEDERMAAMMAAKEAGRRLTDAEVGSRAGTGIGAWLLRAGECCDHRLADCC